METQSQSSQAEPSAPEQLDQFDLSEVDLDELTESVIELLRKDLQISRERLQTHAIKRSFQRW